MRIENGKTILHVGSVGSDYEILSEEEAKLLRDFAISTSFKFDYVVLKAEEVNSEVSFVF